MRYLRAIEIQYTRTVVMNAVRELEVDPDDRDAPLRTNYRSELPGVYDGIPAELIPEHASGSGGLERALRARGSSLSSPLMAS